MTTPLVLGEVSELQQPLTTERLLLRSFDLEDAPAVQQLAGAHEVADTTLNIPHPYRTEMAEAWILSQKSMFRTGMLVNYAVTLRDTQQLVGTIGLRIQPAHRRAELGYWIGVPFWGRGFCTEAAAVVLEFGFKQMDLHRIYAAHLKRNPASGRVLQKLGMSYEGRLREHVRKWDVFEDIERYGITRHEYEQQKRTP
ncbi:MAG: GNAT family N-acetyltransferase [Longimicrobiales bacterium]